METEPHEVSEDDRAELARLIPQYDIVWVHTLRVAYWFGRYHWPHSVLDLDDLPSRQYESAAASGKSLLRRLLNRRMMWIWQRRERTLLERFTAFAVCSENDREYLGWTGRIRVIPNGAPTLALPEREFPKRPRIGFLGNCEYVFNEDGLKWFINEVWPNVQKALSQVELRLVGRGSGGFLAKLGTEITGLGWLEDPGAEIATWSAMIVPIKTGAGTRVKVADGFARGCPVVTTTIGAFGYEVENGKEVLFADTPAEFAAACVRLVTEPSFGAAISERAYLRYLRQLTWDSFEGAVRALASDCLARSKAEPKQ